VALHGLSATAELLVSGSVQKKRGDSVICLGVKSPAQSFMQEFVSIGSAVRDNDTPNIAIYTDFANRR